MGLKKNFKTSSGLELKDVYFKVYNYSCDNKNNVHAKIYGYLSKEHSDSGYASLEGSERIFSLEVEYNENSENTKSQIYKKIKESDEFIDSKDF